nr:hypothetical protein CFP56_07657 [Quercus suber]
MWVLSEKVRGWDYGWILGRRSRWCRSKAAGGGSSSMQYMVGAFVCVSAARIFRSLRGDTGQSGRMKGETKLAVSLTSHLGTLTELVKAIITTAKDEIEADGVIV